MFTWTSILAIVMLLAVLALFCALLRRRRPSRPTELPRFDFDRTKRHEREGRTFPFSS